MTYLFIAFHVLLGGVAYRWRGTDRESWLPLARFLRLLLWSGILTAPAWAFAPWWWALAALAVTVGATSLGHAAYMDFGTFRGPERPIRYARLIRLFTAKLDGVVHDGIGMAATGMEMMVPLAILAGVYFGTTWYLLVLAGALKALAYYLAWFPLRGVYRDPIAVAEVLTGVFLAAGAGVLFFV